MFREPWKREFKKESLPLPWNEESFVLPEASLDIEIGAGNGLFAINYAQKNPDRTLVAIEKTKTRFSRFQGRMSLEGPISNLHVVRDNAIHWISHHIPANSVERYFIHYPNPYPKLAQRNKRWSVMPFMGFLIETLKPGGEITLSTNLPFYMEETKDLMENYWNLNLIDFQEFSSASGEKYATQFEKKYLERGQTCYRMVFQNPPKGS